MDIHNVMAMKHIPGQGIAFDETGRITMKYRNSLIVQWRDGKPYPVLPAHLALAKRIWGTKQSVRVTPGD